MKESDKITKIIDGYKYRDVSDYDFDEEQTICEQCIYRFVPVNMMPCRMCHNKYDSAFISAIGIEKGEIMKNNVMEIKCETEGFEEAQEKVEALVSAYDGFPPQVQIKSCHDCTINIYPSQTLFNECKDEP